MVYGFGRGCVCEESIVYISSIADRLVRLNHDGRSPLTPQVRGREWATRSVDSLVAPYFGASYQLPVASFPVASSFGYES